MRLADKIATMARRGAPLPYDAEVEYLESNGNCYIDTGFKCDDTAGFKVDVMPYIGNVNSRVIGSYSGSNGRWAFVFRADNGNLFYFGWNNASGDLVDSSVVIGNRFTAELNFKNSRKFKVGQTETTLTDALYANQPYNAYIFGNNVNGSVTLSECFKGRMYSAVMTRGDRVEMNFVPVRVGDVGFMYDSVSGRLFGGEGTGTFTVGPDRVYSRKVAYLESHGAEYIKTDIIPFVGMRLNCVFQNTDLTQNRAYVIGRGDNNGGRIQFSYTQGNIFCGNGLGYSSITAPADTDKHTIKIENGDFILDGDVIARVGENISQTSTRGAYLFAFNDRDSLFYVSKIRLYSLSIDGVCDLIPVLDLTGRPAMYDEVSGQLFYNQGTGEFTWGELES